jgi:hypothetical protein
MNLLTRVASASAEDNAAKWRTNFSSWLMSAAAGIVVVDEVLALISVTGGASPRLGACGCPVKS